MDLRELESYRLSDAVKFHDRLNPAIWGADDRMLPEVRQKLLAIADDFKESLGIDVEVQDITVSGSNAAYTYTPRSDIDLHLVADLPRADESDVYRELFDAKKYQYNDQHDFRIGGYDVELYVQDARQPHVSQGIYSVQDDEWIRVPNRRKPTVDDISVRSKYEDMGQRIDAAIKSGDIERMDALAAKIREMRQAGLEKTGEFGPENLAFKILRNNGTLERLRNARLAAKNELMSLEERRKKKGRKKKTRYAYGGYWFPGYHYYGQSSAPAEVSADGGGDGGGGGESVRESAEPGDIQGIIQDFLGFCSHRLGLETQPRIQIKRDPAWSERNGTFGRYDPEANLLIVSVANRHPVDVLRTLAHELTHHRQAEIAPIPDGAGETGTSFEDSANAMAGRIMRDYAGRHPGMFRDAPIEEDWRKRAGAVAAAACIAGTPGCATTDALKTVQTIGRTAQNLPIRAGAEEELRTAIKDRLRQGTGTRESQVAEASGYIPVSDREAQDPRYSMAITQDIRPGEVQRQARKMGFRTDRAGRPPLLMRNLENLLAEFKINEDCWDGYKQQGMKRKGDRMVPNCVKTDEDEDLLEVKMSPAEFQKFLKSPAAEGIRAGFEAELIFRNTQADARGGESEPDWEADERTGGIQDIIDFFQGGDNGISPRAADRLNQELTEQFYDWAREQFANDYFDLDRFISWAEDNVWPDDADSYREDARANLDDDATDEDVEREAVTLFRDDVERDWDRSGAWYEMASEELFDEYMGDLDESDWLDSSGLRYMSDVANGYDLDWPYWTEGGGGGERDWNDIGNSLERVTGMPVRVSGGYHGAARREGQYIIEPDSSLDADDSDDYGLEIVSPPMPLPEAIEQLRRIIDWANGPGDAYTNSSTGLHMGVSLPFKGGDVDPIKLILFMGDKNLLETFGRESNTYARSAYERLESKIRGMRNAGPKQIEGVLNLMKNNLIELANLQMQRGVLGDKYVSVNPHDGYIEFRGPGGDYLSKESEIDGVLENTMLRLAYAMSIAGDNSAYRKEYAKKLYKVLTKDDPANPFMQLFADYSAGTLTGEQLKRQWADTVLQAERGDVEDVPNAVPGEYEVYDKDSGTPGDRDSRTVIDTFQSNSDENALAIAQEKWSGRGVNFGVRAKVAEPEEKKPKSRRAELAQRVTRSTRDVGEQLWRVNHHSSVRWITARSQADAVKQAIQQDRAFNSAETRARIATDLEKAQWNLDQERQRARDEERDAADIRARLGEPRPAGGGERTYRVTWTDRSTMGEVQDSVNVRAGSAQQAMQNIRDELERRGREVIRIEADEITAPARDGEPIPGSTLDLARQRAQQAQGEFTGRWIIKDARGRVLQILGGIGNNQSDANRAAVAWLRRNYPNMVGQGVEVVPEMQ
jgi:hypothetical protein